MPQALQPYLDLAYDAGLALTDGTYAYGLLISATTLLPLGGLLVLIGLIATHGKSHGTRFSAMTLFAFAALAGVSAWLLQPEAAAGTLLGTMLPWCWAPPLLASLSVFVTMPEAPRKRALGLAAATVIALVATVLGGMLSVANTRALNPDQMTWLDAPPMPEQAEQLAPEQAPREGLQVLDTAHPKKR